MTQPRIVPRPAAPPPTDAARVAPAEGTCAQATELWAKDQVTRFTDHLPPEAVLPAYGSPAWADLPARHPLKYAAVVTAAEQWRRLQAEQARLDALLESDPWAYYDDVMAPADAYVARMGRALASTPSFAEWQERRRKAVAEAVRKTRAEPVRATPGWGPVAIAGRPGWWRHLIDGRQVDLPHRGLGQAPHTEGRAAA